MQQTPKADVYGNVTQNNVGYYMKRRAASALRRLYLLLLLKCHLSRHII